MKEIPGLLEKKGFEVYTIDANTIAKALGYSKYSIVFFLSFF